VSATFIAYGTKGQDKRLTQLVFCDISTPSGRTTASDKAAKAGEQTINGVELRALDDMMPAETETEAPRFNVYSDIRQKLINKGIPPEQIALILEANTEVRKKELFAKVRSGQVRVPHWKHRKDGSRNKRPRPARCHARP
jgi:SOS response regulatory protein OraA/RecX